jgi:hypothetical protein
VGQHKELLHHPRQHPKNSTGVAIRNPLPRAIDRESDGEALFSYNAGMLALLLQAAPLLRTAIPQQAAGVTPEWAKTLITAATGAIVGIGSSIVMEFVRPSIAKSIARKTMVSQVSIEFTRNLRMIEAGYQWQQSVDGKQRIVAAKISHVVKLIPPLIQCDRYLFFATSQKAIMYEYDPEGSLERFYRLTNRLVKLCSDNAEIGRIEEALGLAALEGANFVASHKLKYRPSPVTQKEIMLMHTDLLETQAEI